MLPIIIGDTSRILDQYPLLRGKLYLEWNNDLSIITDHLAGLLSHAPAPVDISTRQKPLDGILPPKPVLKYLKGRFLMAGLFVAIVLAAGIAYWTIVNRNSEIGRSNSNGEPLPVNRPPTGPVAVVMPASSSTQTMSRKDRLIYDGFNFAVKLDDDKPIEQGRIVLWFRYPLDSSIKLTPSNYFELSRASQLKTTRQLTQPDVDHQFSLEGGGNFSVRVSSPLFGNDSDLLSVRILITKK